MVKGITTASFTFFWRKCHKWILWTNLPVSHK
ncbi:hypothetical protein GDO81_017737 [Engystomops pustulosus]|uniref:Uncharacterized protein n=1 Tax=Engystomops pustulosus TaxID=76066 RepID=A0AAV7A5M1_ENGPU|nr:hypothetical protein GDO81_017737 [Engystomops pustulosus]